MNKLTATIFLSTTILFNTACANVNNIESARSLEDVDVSRKSEVIDDNLETITIQTDSKDPSKVLEIELDINSSAKEKINRILDNISEECFNGLPIEATIVNNNVVEIELTEYNDEKKKVSWEDDYLNKYSKKNTINLIVKNIIEDKFKSEISYIKDVRIYYNDKLITLD
ncbi:hypothetical protein EAI30_10660 [Romboutsia ilealis]|uniref:Lipoprotein n=1 Tax=Romboutsia faecis TaxID=2764597 RepID=A0ABR7JMX1_9FIRM|nr:hypothetical protein [Romboutsia faecis]MBC5996281.1 hypothetical protein [Romboutsia faecis]MRN25078.1 hypothetical protein [Romboutsia ilealis]